MGGDASERAISGLSISDLSVRELEQRFGRGAVLPPGLLQRLRRDRRRGVQRLCERLEGLRARERAEQRRLDRLLEPERARWRVGVRRVAGVDEAGTGPLAGPVVAAAVVFAPETRIAGVDDSKRLDPRRRLELAAEIEARAEGVGVGVAEVEEIDRLNVYHAALLAMRRAVEALREPPEELLVDARRLPSLSLPQQALPKGDARSFSIAAASIVAKTRRDARMQRLDALYPGYGFAQHKGYGTAAHQRALRELGPSPVHRMSFPVLGELCGSCSGAYAELRERILRAETSSELRAVEAALGAEVRLPQAERRRLRLSLARRERSLASGPSAPESGEPPPRVRRRRRS